MSQELEKEGSQIRLLDKAFMKNASNTATVQIENSNKSNKLVNGAAINPSSKSILKSKTHIN